MYSITLITVYLVYNIDNDLFLILRYGGGTSVLGGSRSGRLFGGGGRGAFALGAGAGFLGMKN